MWYSVSSKSLTAMVCVGESWYRMKMIFTLPWELRRSSFGHVRFIFRLTLGSRSWVSVTVSGIATNMGNILQRNAPSDGAFPTPKIPTLTPAEVQIIKSSWKIPSANVSEEVYIYEALSIVTGRCLLSIHDPQAFDSAELIFYTFLERFPENQQRFGSFKDVPLAELKVRESLEDTESCARWDILTTKLFSQGTPGFRAHASKIFNVFSCVIDALDKDPDLKGIKKIIAEGVRKFMISFS